MADDKNRHDPPKSPSDPILPKESAPIPENPRVGEGSGQDALARGAQQPRPEPTTAAEQGIAPGKAGDVAEGRDPNRVEPEPPAVKPVAPVAVNEPPKPQPGTPPASKGAAERVAGAERAEAGKTAAPAKPHEPPKPAVAPMAATPWSADIVTRLQQRYGSGIRQAATYLGQNFFVIDRSIAHECLQLLRDDEQFDYCVDVTCVHWPERDRQFEVIWILYSFPHNERLRVKMEIAEGETAPSVADLWSTANWLEREAYDMFGVRFEGHPDLRRILLPDDWKGHPLRKDYGIIQQDQEWVQIHLGIESGQ
jgi:NADH-quinone oxidoreductase subunit C